MARYASYIICTTSRTGSTLLCTMLSATGIAGNPDSYFHVPSLDRWAKQWNLRPLRSDPDADLFRSVTAAVLKAGTANTDIFGLRLMRKSFGYLAQLLAACDPGQPDDATRFKRAFGSPLYIHLTRGDKIAQAVSLLKATQTGLWHAAPDGTEIERTAPPKQPTYDATLIAQHVAELCADDAAWGDWFERENIQPLHLTYEDLAQDPQGTLTDILRRLGLEHARAGSIKPQVAKLADKTSQDWIAQFRACNSISDP